jgi:hypothetical protein
LVKSNFAESRQEEIEDETSSMAGWISGETIQGDTHSEGRPDEVCLKGQIFFTLFPDLYKSAFT